MGRACRLLGSGLAIAWAVAGLHARAADAPAGKRNDPPDEEFPRRVLQLALRAGAVAAPWSIVQDQSSLESGMSTAPGFGASILLDRGSWRTGLLADRFRFEWHADGKSFSRMETWLGPFLRWPILRRGGVDPYVQFGTLLRANSPETVSCSRANLPFALQAELGSQWYAADWVELGFFVGGAFLPLGAPIGCEDTANFNGRPQASTIPPVVDVFVSLGLSITFALGPANPAP
jgi:hypothetical protein